MGDKKYKPAVSLQAVVKYVVKERDHYKEKLAMVTAYAKKLEAEKEQENADLHQEVSRIRERLERKNKEYEDLYRENAALKKGYHDTQWYQSLMNLNKQLREKITNLTRMNNNLVAENHLLKSGGKNQK